MPQKPPETPKQVPAPSDSTDRSAEVQPPSAAVSRRAFIKGTGLTVAALGVAGPGSTELAHGITRQDPDVAPIVGPGATTMKLSVNGTTLSIEAPPSTTLADALRDVIGLTGTKRVCDRGSCGACTVMIDGRTVDSCSMLAIDAVGHQITTVEGCGTPESPSAIQQAFVECDALQCGFCTPGMVVSCTALLAENQSPSRAEVAKGIAGNICRCGTYENIFEAVELVKQRGGSGGR